jgi:hypothetical protein
VEPVGWVEIVEFVVYTEMARNSTIVEIQGCWDFNGGLGVAPPIEVADELCFSCTNRQTARKRFLITCHNTLTSLGAIQSLQRRMWNSTISAFFDKIPQFPEIPQLFLLFGECYGQVGPARLCGVAMSSFLQPLNLSIVASAVAVHRRLRLWKKWKLWNFRKSGGRVLLVQFHFSTSTGSEQIHRPHARTFGKQWVFVRGVSFL